MSLDDEDHEMPVRDWFMLSKGHAALAHYATLALRGYFKVENLKLVEGKYTVEISSKNISHMKNESIPIEYWIALEPESNYSV